MPWPLILWIAAIVFLFGCMIYMIFREGKKVYYIEVINGWYNVYFWSEQARRYVNVKSYTTLMEAENYIQKEAKANTIDAVLYYDEKGKRI